MGNAMSCHRVRERLCEAGSTGVAGSAGSDTGGAGREAHEHLASCKECAAFARRLELARQALARPLLSPSDLAPDAGFAARVLARIERPSELLGWAAFRTLPAALGLALALAWFGAAAQSAPQPAVELLGEMSPSADQLIAWSATSPEVWP